MGRPRAEAAPGVCPARLAGVGAQARSAKAWEVRSRYSRPAAVRAGRPSPRGPRAPGPRSGGGRGPRGPPAAAEGPRTPPAGRRGGRRPPRSAPGSGRGPAARRAGAAGPRPLPAAALVGSAVWRVERAGARGWRWERAVGVDCNARSRAPLAALPQPQRPRRTGALPAQGERRGGQQGEAQSSGTHAPEWGGVRAGEMQVRGFRVVAETFSGGAG